MSSVAKEKIMATRKTTTTRKTNSTAAKRPRKRSVGSRNRNGSGTLTNFFVPLFFIVGILFCLGFLGFMGYRTVTASDFFDVKTVDVRGASRASKDDIERIVKRQTEKSGVWNAELSDIKNDVEKLTFVKSAIVARVLPDGLRVSIVERAPRVVALTSAGEVWTDEEATILCAVGKNESRPPFSLRGWDESKTEKAAKENQERVKIYLKMLDEWQDFELGRRVSAVDLSDVRMPQAIVQDSGEQVTITLSKENFGKRLQTGLEKIAGKGKEVKSIDVSGTQPILGFREKQNS